MVCDEVELPILQCIQQCMYQTVTAEMKMRIVHGEVECSKISTYNGAVSYDLMLFFI